MQSTFDQNQPLMVNQTDSSKASISEQNKQNARSNLLRHWMKLYSQVMAMK